MFSFRAATSPLRRVCGAPARTLSSEPSHDTYSGESVSLHAHQRLLVCYFLPLLVLIGSAVVVVVFGEQEWG